VPRKIIIDCDPGQDDAVALFLALASPDELDVLGITTVAGNVPLDLTQRNARMMCDIAGRTDMSMARPGSTVSTCLHRRRHCRNSTRSISSSKL
jgi:inosine-uridine nucleoside N-ribohydrolase